MSSGEEKNAVPPPECELYTPPTPEELRSGNRLIRTGAYVDKEYTFLPRRDARIYLEEEEEGEKKGKEWTMDPNVLAMVRENASRAIEQGLDEKTGFIILNRQGWSYMCDPKTGKWIETWKPQKDDQKDFLTEEKDMSRVGTEEWPDFEVNDTYDGITPDHHTEKKDTD